MRIISAGPISIHASRGGSDRNICRCPYTSRYFNPRFPRGKRHFPPGTGRACYQFQSTLPAGEATKTVLLSLSSQTFQSTLPAGEATISCKVIFYLLYFNPRFPRGKRRRGYGLGAINQRFQSTLPAGEATLYFMTVNGESIFQSTLPAGEATLNAKASQEGKIISIHASRGGSDDCDPCEACEVRYFNPRFPRGKRQYGQAVP